MKILHVLNELRPSGAETMLRLAAPLWGSAGYQCDIVSTGHTLGAYAKTLESAGYRIHHLPVRANPAYFFKFARLVKHGGYQLVHQHAENMRYWFCLSALAAGAKVATSVHSSFQFDGELRWRRTIQRRHLRRLGVTFVAIAPGVQENERQRFGIDSRLVWNWFDTNRFRPISAAERVSARARLGLAASDKVVVSLGNCSGVKNHAAILRALVQLPDVTYVHVGQEDEACSERVLASQLGLLDRVRFLGWLEDPQLALAASDVYVMPSLYEGLGIAALEAIGSGLPCVLSRVPGLVDLDSLGLGLAYTESAPDSLAQEIEKIFQELGHHTEMARRNARALGLRLAPSAGASGYAQVWRELACAR